jgi:hypothetical protein
MFVISGRPNIVTLKVNYYTLGFYTTNLLTHIRLTLHLHLEESSALLFLSFSDNIIYEFINRLKSKI